MDTPAVITALPRTDPTTRGDSAPAAALELTVAPGWPPSPATPAATAPAAALAAWPVVPQPADLRSTGARLASWPAGPTPVDESGRQWELHVALPHVPGAGGLIALLVGVCVGAVLARVGWVDESSATLQEMGFDPDRAMLIASLVACLGAAAAGTFVTGSRVAPILASFAVLAGLFGRTFANETRVALNSAGSDGVFNPVGWSMTGATLITISVAVGWVAVTLARPVRGWPLETTRQTGSGLRRRRVSRAGTGRPLALIATLAIVAVSMPIVGDMLNFSPDARMRQGAGPAVGLYGGNDQTSAEPSTVGEGSTGPGAAGGAGATGRGTGSGAGSGSTIASDPSDENGSPDGSDGTGGTDASSGRGGPPADTGLPPTVLSLGPGPVAGTLVTTHAVAAQRPWLAWRPTGAGRVVVERLPAMWVDGTSTTTEVAVYLPAGYDQGNRHYPVLYQMPWSLSTWSGALQLTETLDTLIAAGDLPPSIAVFVTGRGGPYPDSECVDSYDGRELFDTFVTRSVVPWVDSTFRTLARPEARTLFGFSVGGFCAPSIALRHPDLFRQAVAFDGYFVAAPTDIQTLNAWRPFGNDPRRIAAAAPLNLAATLTQEQRQVQSGVFGP